MDVATHVAHLAAHAPALRDAAERAGLDAPVPGLEWDVRSLVLHTGGIHRWAADIVAAGRRDFATEAGRAVGTGPGDEELLDWFTAGYTTLLDTLRAAPDDIECGVFLPAPSPLAFWARRQAHETAIHRADAEAAAGSVIGFDPEFAYDGIGELVQGFAARKSNAIGTPATMALVPTDHGVPWQLRFGGERTEAVAGAAAPDADLVVTGTASELYLWLWNRRAPVTVSGDEQLAAVWAKTVRVRWGG